MKFFWPSLVYRYNNASWQNKYYITINALFFMCLSVIDTQIKYNILVKNVGKVGQWPLSMDSNKTIN